MDEKRYYIYVFCDDTKPGKFIYDNLEFDYEPFYIGKGTKDRIVTSMCNRGTFKYSKIKSIKNRGGEVIRYKLFENLNNLESLELEKVLISKIGRRDINKGPLTNLTDGGEGRVNVLTSIETKRKISETKKSQNLHTPHTAETKKVLKQINLGEKNPMYGKTHTDEVKEKQSLLVSGSNHPMYGKKHNEETIQKIKDKRNNAVNQKAASLDSKLRNNKAVLQYDLDNIFIAEFEAIKVASIELKISESLIGKTCRGVVKNPRKFIFKFKEENNKVLNNSYELKEGDIYESFRLIKRCKMTVIVEENGIEKILRKKEYPIFWAKKVIL